MPPPPPRDEAPEPIDLDPPSRPAAPPSAGNLEDKFFSNSSMSSGDTADDLSDLARPKRTKLLVGAAIGGALLLAVVGVLVFSGGEASPPTVENKPPAPAAEAKPETKPPAPTPAEAKPEVKPPAPAANPGATANPVNPAATPEVKTPPVVATPTPPPAAATPAPPAAGGDAEFEKLIKQGKLANQAERFKSAAVAYRKALALKPDSVEAKAGLGIALVNSDPGNGGYREAVQLLQDAIKSDESNARAWLSLGMAYQFTNQRQQAAAAYRKYLVIEPRGPAASDVRAMLKELGN